MSGTITQPIVAAQPIVYVPAPSLTEVKAGNAVLQKGHKGDAVSYVQELLQIQIDRRFGNDTETAVKTFQQQSGMATEPEAVGKVGRILLSALETAAGIPPWTPFNYNKRHKLDNVHPVLRERVQQLAAALAARQMDFLITDGMRTFEEQDALFRKGRKLVNGMWVPIDPVHKTGIVTNARAGRSNHNYGLAIDSYPVISGRVYTEIPPHASSEFRQRFNAIQTAIGEEGERVNLAWGGRWSNPYDPPHLQLFPQSEMTSSTCLTIYETNGNSLSAVWQEADSRLA